jgi:hypothetical protein
MPCRFIVQMTRKVRILYDVWYVIQSCGLKALQFQVVCVSLFISSVGGPMSGWADPAAYVQTMVTATRL